MAEMSVYHCLELPAPDIMNPGLAYGQFETGITAIDAITHIISMGPELIIGDQDKAKSAVAIDAIMPMLVIEFMSD